MAEVTDIPLEPFDPAWLKHEELAGGRMTMPAIPADESRALFDSIFAGIKQFIPAKTDAVQTKDITIPDSHVKLRVYVPQTDSAKSRSSLPVGLYIHAGGWFAGSIEHEDWVARYVCEHASMILFSVEYRLAPENPFPAGLDDCCLAYEYMYNHASEFGGDSRRKSTMGGSAAGNLALAVAAKYADHSDLKVKGCHVAALASCDPKVLPEEYKKRYTPELYRDAPMIGNEIVALAREWLNAPLHDPLYNPLLHPNLSLIPKIYIAACSKDPTHQETVFLMEECTKLGMQVEFREWKGWPHYFWVLPHLPMTYEFLNTWSKMMKWINE